MPQTLEHLAVLEHLGVPLRHPGASPSADLVEREWLELVLTRGERAAGAARRSAFEPPIASSAPTGDGPGSSYCAGIADHARPAGPPRAPGDLFRLPVDRAFSLAGVGTVVTGTAWSGRVDVGDAVALLPGRLGWDGCARSRVTAGTSSGASRARAPRWARGHRPGRGESRDRAGRRRRRPGQPTHGARRRAGARARRAPPAGPADPGPRASRHGGGHGAGRCRGRRSSPGARGLARLALEAPAGGAWGRPFRHSELQPGQHDRWGRGARSAAATATPRDGRPQLAASETARAAGSAGRAPAGRRAPRRCCPCCWAFPGRTRARLRPGASGLREVGGPLGPG